MQRIHSLQFTHSHKRILITCMKIRVNLTSFASQCHCVAESTRSCKSPIRNSTALRLKILKSRGRPRESPRDKIIYTSLYLRGIKDSHGEDLAWGFLRPRHVLRKPENAVTRSVRNAVLLGSFLTDDTRRHRVDNRETNIRTVPRIDYNEIIRWFD